MLGKGEYRIQKCKTSELIPSKIKCPLCEKDHKTRQEGAMHFFICKKNNKARFFVGWNDKMMVHPPSESVYFSNL